VAILGPMDIAVIGGTGEEGFGLSLRLGKAGRHVIIGSRSDEKGAASADKAREILGGGEVEGTTNQAAAEKADVVFVTVPYAGQADIYRSIKDNVAPGKIVVDCTSPLATAVGGRAWQVVTPWHGSAAEQAKAILDPGVRMVAAFHTIAGGQLQDLSRPMDSDVVVCGKDAEAKAAVGELIEAIPDLRWVDAGDLSMARIAETMTALLISVNRAYRIHDSGFRVTGRDAWGAPPPKKA
jgi:8-hydroxy-5-deazaflavin:NADPH oxidoreductase